MAGLDNLCGQCENIDLNKVFRGGYETPQQVRSLGTVPESQLSSPCPLCRLVAEAIYHPFCDASLSSYHQTCDRCRPSNEDTERSSYFLVAVRVTNTGERDGMGHSKLARYQDSFLQTEKLHVDLCFSKSNQQSNSQMQSQLKDGEFIALKVGRLTSSDSTEIAYYGSIYLASGAMQSARLLSHPTVDWDVLRSFLTDCQSGHAVCSSLKRELHIENFLLIDCKSKKLIKAGAEDDYVALSYVWGQPERNVDPEKLVVGSKLPKTASVIEDAMRVVTELGYQYLWVDRYCIPQNDPASIKDHLSKMHLVYLNASFTIVAAASIDSSFGLPGVNATPRSAQTYANVGDYQLVSAVEVFLSSSKCKWNTRAWTYQEGLFAPRQLIFGSHQVSFHCKQAEQSEIYLRPVKSNEQSALTLRSQARSIWEHIEHFTQRSLTYESDALNAIKATLNAFDCHPEQIVANLWGIPFSQSITPLDYPGISTETQDSGKSGLLSNASFASESAIFGFGLAWRMSNRTPDELQTLRRRADFPSWSWASCIGHIIFPRLSWIFDKDINMPDPELQVELETLDGEIVPISTYLTNQNAIESSKYLHVEGWSVRNALTFHLEQGTVSLDLGDNKYELTGSIQLDSFPNYGSHNDIFNILSEKRNKKKLWEAIVVWFSPRDGSNAIKPFLLVLIKVEDSKYSDRDVYERIGNIPSLSLNRMPKRKREMKANRPRSAQKGPRMTVRWAAEMMSEKYFIPYDATQSTTEASQVVENEETESDSDDRTGDESNENETTSDDSDSSDMGDYTINMFMIRRRAAMYYPRIPMVRRKFILR